MNGKIAMSARVVFSPDRAPLFFILLSKSVRILTPVSRAFVQSSSGYLFGYLYRSSACLNWLSLRSIRLYMSLRRCGAGSHWSGSLCWLSAHSMMSRLSSITCPVGSSRTGTVPFGDISSLCAGLSRRIISRCSRFICA